MEDSLVLFVAARRVSNVVLFSSGREVFYLYCSSRSTSLECRAVFLREGSLLFVLFVAARPVRNVVLFSSRKKVFCLNRLSPLDEFGTSCCFPRGGKTLFCLSSLNWTSCLTSRCSTNLERRAVFFREKIDFCLRI